MLQTIAILAVLQTSQAEPGFDQIADVIREQKMKNVVVIPTAAIKQPQSRGGGEFIDSLVGNVAGQLLGQALGGSGGGIPGLGGGGFPGGGGGIPGLGGGGFPGGGGGFSGLGGGGFPGGGGGFLGGNFGANMNSFPQQLAGQLAGQLMSQGGNVVSKQTTCNMVGGMCSGDVYRTGGQANIRKLTNADGMALVEMSQEGNKYCQTCKLYDLRISQRDSQTNPMAQARPVKQFVAQDAISLGTLAYGGNSFEAFRPVDNSPILELKPVGFSELPPGTDVDSTRSSEAELYKHLTYWKQDFNRHPLASDSDIPYRFEIVVDGQVRQLIPYDGKMLVRLEHGETFTIRVTNSLNVAVRFGAWIDGVNTIGKRMENPGMVNEVQDLNGRIWFFKGGTKFDFNGWRENDVVSQREFVVDRPENSVAASLGSSEKLGMITGIFYQAGNEQPRARGAIGIGQGNVRQVPVQFVRSTVGPMLAAMTVYYRTQKELDEIIELPPLNPSTNDEATAFPVAARNGNDK
jgi:hypothetical protein